MSVHLVFFLDHLRTLSRDISVEHHSNSNLIHDPDVLSHRAFFALANLELNTFAISQRFWYFALVNEQVLAAVRRSDEPEALY